MVAGQREVRGLTFYAIDKVLRMDISSDELLRDLGRSLKTLEMGKHMVGWDLEMLEAATQIVQDRELDSDDESDHDHDTPAPL